MSRPASASSCAMRAVPAATILTPSVFELLLVIGLPVDHVANVWRAIAAVQFTGPSVVLATSLTLGESARRRAPHDRRRRRRSVAAAHAAPADPRQRPPCNLDRRGCSSCIGSFAAPPPMRSPQLCQASTGIVAATAAAGAKELSLVEAKRNSCARRRVFVRKRCRVERPTRTPSPKNWIRPQRRSERNAFTPSGTERRDATRSTNPRALDREPMTILTVNHITAYAYAEPVRLGEHRMMLRPRDSNDQRLLEATLDIEPRPQSLRWIHDVFDNCVAIAKFAGTTRRLRVESNLTWNTRRSRSLKPCWRNGRASIRSPMTQKRRQTWLVRLSATTPTRPANGSLGSEVSSPRAPTETGTLLMTMTYAIKEGLTYARRSEKGTQSPLQTLASRRGSCRDFATLMIEAARAIGLAARFVSGYLYVPDRDAGQRHLGGGSTHAWCQIYLPGAGWVEFDPTNGIVGNRDLIRIAVARDAHQAIPLHGSISATPPRRREWKSSSAFGGCPKGNLRSATTLCLRTGERLERVAHRPAGPWGLLRWSC